jgi:hypothetical protein
MRIQRQVERQERTIFNSACSLTNVREVRDRLHKHIAIDVLTQVPLSSNLNLWQYNTKVEGH